jgi:hypothetical protein
MIGGHDVIEEYLACDMHLLSASFGFRVIADGETQVSKLIIPQPDFRVANAKGESDAHFLAITP